MAGSSFGKRGTDLKQPEPVITAQSDEIIGEPEAGINTTAFLTVGLIAAGVVVGGIFAWSQKDTISATLDGWSRSVAEWQAGPSDKKKFTHNEKSLGSYSVLGASARIARLAMIDYENSPLKDPKTLTKNPREFIKSYNYDVFVKATKLYALADACKDKTAKAIAVTVIRVSTGRKLSNIAKLGRILKKGDQSQLTSSERDCKKRVPGLVNEVMGMVQLLDNSANRS